VVRIRNCLFSCDNDVVWYVGKNILPPSLGCILSYPGDGGGMFLQNIGAYLQTTWYHNSENHNVIMHLVTVYA
jgi:hypothetical protein